MTVKIESLAPWARTLAEILEHGIALLKQDSDTNRRLALILIDNSVEQMVKTFLGLPRRITGINISRKDYAEIAESFPRLLDALEKHAASKIQGINLGELEWHHRLRNELYHSGNGLTVSKQVVTIYAELARLLFGALFDTSLDVKVSETEKLLGKFLSNYLRLQRALESNTLEKTERGVFRIVDPIRTLLKNGRISKELHNEINEIRASRNSIVHGREDISILLTPDRIRRTDEIAAEIEKLQQT